MRAPRTGGWPALLVALGASCYSPDIPSGKFACTMDTDCPGALLCRPVAGKGSRCVDTAPPVMNGAACAGEGVMLSAAVWGCRGSFSSGGAGGLCKGGWHVCELKDAARLALGAACTDTTGFFSSRIPVERVREAAGGMQPRPYDVDCDIGGTVDLPWGLIGCGTEDGARRIGNKDNGEKCPGLTTALSCGATSRWTCTGDGLDRAVYDGKGNGGVLCCAD